MRLTKIDNQAYLIPSWEEMAQLCFRLAQQILMSNIKFDRLTALAKGGLTWARTLLDYLQIKNLSVFQVKFYHNIGKVNKRAVIVQSLPVAVEKESLLLFDDVVDSGETLKIAKEYLYMCGAKKVVSASLFIKNWVKSKPDFYAKRTSAWIIFPHEVRETIQLLNEQWRGKKIEQSEIKKRLIKLGLSRKEIDFFLRRDL